MDPRILELLASRICHDLISPVGAVQNGVEFLQDLDMSEDLEDGFDLIAHSVKMASARLKVFRLVYGIGGRDNSISPEDIYNAFEDYLQSEGKVTQEWDPHGPLGIETDMNGFSKVLLGALLLSYEFLPRGGTISVQEGENETLIEATGQSANIRENVKEAIDQDMLLDDLDPRLVHPYVISVLAKDLGFTVTLKDTRPNQVIVSIARS